MNDTERVKRKSHKWLFQDKGGHAARAKQQYKMPNIIIRDTSTKGLGRVVEYFKNTSLEEVPDELMNVVREYKYFEIEETEDCYIKRNDRWWICECEEKSILV